jgi:hypothetical protein
MKIKREALLQKLFWISNDDINALRSRVRAQTIRSNQLKFNSAQASIGMQPYVKFLSNFSQYNGLGLYYKLIEPRTEEVKAAFDIISSSIGQYEK